MDREHDWLDELLYEECQKGITPPVRVNRMILEKTKKKESRKILITSMIMSLFSTMTILALFILGVFLVKNMMWKKIFILAGMYYHLLLISISILGFALYDREKTKKGVGFGNS